jgi:hypothetical protein
MSPADGNIRRATFFAFPNSKRLVRALPCRGRDNPESWDEGRAAPGAGNASVIRRASRRQDSHRRPILREHRQGFPSVF